MYLSHAITWVVSKINLMFYLHVLNAATRKFQVIYMALITLLLPREMSRLCTYEQHLTVKFPVL